MNLPMHPSINFGIGAYSFADAARFIGAESRELRRWIDGYAFKSRDGSTTFSPPLWDSQLKPFQVDGIGFRDLMELRFVHTFRTAGVSLPIIRDTLRAAREAFHTRYPFTCERFMTDGKRIFTEVVEQSGDTSLIDLPKRQNVIAKVIRPSLREGIEVDARGGAARWFPIKKSKVVVLDPERSFGEPILSEYGIPTIALREAVFAEDGDLRRVARIYEIPLAAVRKAVEFETRTASP